MPIAGARVQFVMSQDETGDLVDIVLKVLETSEEGYTEWVHSRTGTLVRAELEQLPWKYLGMDAMERVSEQQTMVRLVDKHELNWYVPKKPSVSVRVHDAASGERVIGIRYRVMTRPHGAVAPQPRVSFGGTLLLDAVGKVCIIAEDKLLSLCSCWPFELLHAMFTRRQGTARISAPTHSAGIHEGQPAVFAGAGSCS